MKKLALNLFLSLFTLTLFSQSGETYVEDPPFLQKIQGTWVNTKPGTIWNKTVISGNTFESYSASPEDGEWSLMKTYKLTTPVKVTKRNNYDGKTFSYSYVLSEEDNLGNYIAVFDEIVDGKRMIYIEVHNSRPESARRPNYAGDVQGKKRTYLRKVPSNFNPWL